MIIVNRCVEIYLVSGWNVWFLVTFMPDGRTYSLMA